MLYPVELGVHVREGYRFGTATPRWRRNGRERPCRQGPPPTLAIAAVVTRRGLWGRPSTPVAAMDQIAAWRESPSFRILHDTEACLDILHDAAVSQSVTGALIHDARIAVCCQVNGIAELWTVDRDFSRFPGFRCRNPLSH